VKPAQQCRAATQRAEDVCVRCSSGCAEPSGQACCTCCAGVAMHVLHDKSTPLVHLCHAPVLMSSQYTSQLKPGSTAKYNTTGVLPPDRCLCPLPPLQPYHFPQDMGPEHPVVAISLQTLGHVLRLRQQLEEALEVAKRCEALRSASSSQAQGPQMAAALHLQVGATPQFGASSVQERIECPPSRVPWVVTSAPFSRPLQQTQVLDTAHTPRNCSHARRCVCRATWPLRGTSSLMLSFVAAAAAAAAGADLHRHG
jgi:hypothetical protein